MQDLGLPFPKTLELGQKEVDLAVVFDGAFVGALHPCLRVADQAAAHTGRNIEIAGRHALEHAVGSESLALLDRFLAVGRNPDHGKLIPAVSLEDDLEPPREQLLVVNHQHAYLRPRFPPCHPGWSRRARSRPRPNAAVYRLRTPTAVPAFP